MRRCGYAAGSPGACDGNHDGLRDVTAGFRTGFRDETVSILHSELDSWIKVAGFESGPNRKYHNIHTVQCVEVIIRVHGSWTVVIRNDQQIRDKKRVSFKSHPGRESSGRCCGQTCAPGLNGWNFTVTVR